jgi:hypothetical protein
MTTYHLTCDGCGAEVNASETEAHTRNCAGRPTYPDVTLDLSTFQRCGPEGQEDARLLGRLDINGVPHHVEAYRVKLDNGVQVVDGVGELAAWFADWDEASGATGPYLTIEWDGALWAVFVSPHCD